MARKKLDLRPLHIGGFLQYVELTLPKEAYEFLLEEITHPVSPHFLRRKLEQNEDGWIGILVLLTQLCTCLTCWDLLETHQKRLLRPPENLAYFSLETIGEALETYLFVAHNEAKRLISK